MAFSKASPTSMPMANACVSSDRRLVQRPLHLLLQQSPKFLNSGKIRLRPQNRRIRLPAIAAIGMVYTGFNTDEDQVQKQSIETHSLEEELRAMVSLRSSLAAAKSLSEKIDVLDRHPRVRLFFGRGELEKIFNMRQQFLLKCLVAIGQQHVLDDDNISLRKVASEKSSSRLLKSAFHILIRMIDDSSNYKEVSKENEFLELRFGQDDEVEGSHASVALDELISTLEEMETFYNCIGGIVGYQVSVLEIILGSKPRRLISNNHGCEEVNKVVYAPTGIDLSSDKDFAAQAAFWGIEALPRLGEIYPLGGSGDRLGLVDKYTGECLPVAMLPYCGRTLLEGLIRDLQAREFLYYKLFGKQIVTPVAIMTSSAKDNHEHITKLCEKNNWFGRGRSTFNLFEQPLVPTVGAEDGRWVTSGPFQPALKPGGHGVIWKLASDKGVFNWFYGHGCKAATVRQISNPVASTDVTLLALAGIGFHYQKKLGFASCQRKVGATEGVNVLVEKRRGDGSWEYGITCIEYTEFEKFGITDAPISPESTQAQYPANTNVLYVDLPSVEKIASNQTAESLPGMILNLKKSLKYDDDHGIQHSLYAGRLECTMQNVADSFLTSFSERSYVKFQQDSFGVTDKLDTFIVYNERRKVTSSAKKERRKSNNTLHQTPEGSFLDIMRNAYDLLTASRIDMPKVEDNNHYLCSPPPFLVFLHPALGPIWEITRQKFQGGCIKKGAELQLEIAEFFWKDVELDGSLLVLAENIMGSRKSVNNETPSLVYGYRCGKCRLQNVKILNKGVNWNSSENIYWQHKVDRFQSFKIVIHGNGEFEAHDVALEGDHTFEVPDGYSMCVTQDKTGLCCTMRPLRKDVVDSGSWHWNYLVKQNHALLEMRELQ